MNATLIKSQKTINKKIIKMIKNKNYGKKELTCETQKLYFLFQIKKIPHPKFL